MELEQAIDEHEHTLDQRGSKLEEPSKWVEKLEEEEMEMRSPQLGRSLLSPTDSCRIPEDS